MNELTHHTGWFGNGASQDQFLTLRPKLRNEILLLPSKNGLHLKRANQYLGVQYASVYTEDAQELIYLLSKYLTGDWTVMEICGMFQGRVADEIAGLLKFLFKNGYVTHVEDDARDEVLKIIGNNFEDQIKFLSHCSTRPWAAFRDFRNAKILLAGGGISLRTCAVVLLRSGLERLSLLPITVDEEDNDLQEVNEVASSIRAQGVNTQVSIAEFGHQDSFEEYDLIAFCADMPYLRNLLAFERKSILCGRPFYPGIAAGNCAFVGPLIKPGSGVCWVCNIINVARGFIEENLINSFQKDYIQSNLSLGPEFAPSGQLAKMMGAEVAFELFKSLAGVIRPEIQNYMQVYITKNSGAIRLNPMSAPPEACSGMCGVIEKRVADEYHISTKIVRPDFL